MIGLMNRLSAYAERESQTESPEDKKKSEEDATAKLLEKLKISKNKSNDEAKPDGADTEHVNGEQSNGDKTSEVPQQKEGQDGDSKKEPEATNGENTTATPIRTRGIPEDVKLYEIFYNEVTHLVHAQRLPIQDTIALLVSLSNLALNIYPDRLDYIDQVLTYANEKVAQYANSADLHSAPTQSNILNLLLAPIKSYFSLFTALALPNYIPLLHAQTYPTRRAVAGEVARSILRYQTKISNAENLEGVLEILRVLVSEGMQQPGGYPGVPSSRRGAETEETIEEQGWLARIIHLIQSSDNDTEFKLLQASRKTFAEGNERIKYTTPALLTQSLRLARKYKSREHYDDTWQTQLSALYKFMHNSISALYTRVNGAADLCLRLFISCGQVADQTGFEEVSYEFFAQAFTIYEEAISDSRAQFQAVCIIAGALQGTRGFSKENYDTLITKCALHGSKLLKKPDQCRAVYMASHLWWAVEIPSKGEEDSKDVRVLTAVNQFVILTVPASPRWQTCSRMPSESFTRSGCLYGFGCLRRAFRGNPESICLLL